MRTLAYSARPVKSAPWQALAIADGVTQLRASPAVGGMGQGLDDIADDATLEDLIVAARHLEDLEIFVGQRSRLHPGPGWDVVLAILRRDLATVRMVLRDRELSGQGCEG